MNLVIVEHHRLDGHDGPPSIDGQSGFSRIPDLVNLLKVMACESLTGGSVRENWTFEALDLIRINILTAKARHKI